MNEFESARDYPDLIRRALLFVVSLGISSWIVIRFIALGMFGSQAGFSWHDYWQESMLQAFLGGLLLGLFWGRSSLKNIFWLAVPCGAWFAIMLVTLPFALFTSADSFKQGEWLEYLSGLLLFFCAACFPLLGPTLSHAIRKGMSWPEIRELLAQQWKQFRQSWKSQPSFGESVRFARDTPNLMYRIMATAALIALLWLFGHW